MLLAKLGFGLPPAVLLGLRSTGWSLLHGC
jgi:hypothetical protein